MSCSITISNVNAYLSGSLNSVFGAISGNLQTPFVLTISVTSFIVNVTIKCYGNGTGTTSPVSIAGFGCT